MEYRLFFLVCLYLTISAFSCDEGIESDASVKYRVSGSVVDQNGIPLEDIKVVLTAFIDNYIYWDNKSLLKYTRTDYEGKFDFVVSDAVSLGSVLEVNSINGYCFNVDKDFNSLFDSKQFFYTDESHVDYEIEFDVVLHPSLPVRIANSFNYNVAYQMSHNGVSDIDSINEDYWMQLRRLDTVTHYLRPNQNINITYSSSYSGSIKDTIVELGSQPLFIELDSI